MDAEQRYRPDMPRAAAEISDELHAAASRAAAHAGVSLSQWVGELIAAKIYGPDVLQRLARIEQHLGLEE